jgi:hypothetical protein
MSGTIMRNTLPTRTNANRTDDLKPEYRFDYKTAKPNRFAEQIRKGSVAVLLDPDVARVFKDAETVNAVLRNVMATMPTASSPAAR